MKIIAMYLKGDFRQDLTYYRCFHYLKPNKHHRAAFDFLYFKSDITI